MHYPVLKYDLDTKALKELLDAGAAPNTADARGRSPVMYAIFGGAPDTMTLLSQRRADPEQETNCGKFPWLYASQSPLRQRFLRLWGR
ncbi:hypothetical protein [Marispirochaeta sp.]|jgi:ankyrin repeat protein|uniref:hypothetical protein n=1 Tax=Marispirochaeta sp. TaxID=2038653 RepID=UPI0029C6E3C0|nr:hypothetical protein [Marispirochaeta sp.]